MVKHIVTFKFKGDDNKRRQVAEEFKAALLSLPEQIDVLRSMEVGINENPNEQWDLVLIAVVDKMEDVDIYAVGNVEPHPLALHEAGIQLAYLSEVERRIGLSAKLL